MCYGIRISSPFHLGTQIISIHILNCPKIAKNACTDMEFLECISMNVDSMENALPQMCNVPPWMWNALHIHIQGLPFSLNVNSEKPEMFWESKATKCMGP